MTHTFLWHDYETFGTDPARDRPAQFAAIRTDLELNEIGQPIMLYCQQTPDYLPSPTACMITGITPQYCNEHGIPEYQFAEFIQRELSQPGTIGVGYNSIRFDDEFTRYLFWRNLIDPYAREWQNQCGRWDLLDVVRTAYALRPESLNWPVTEAGDVSFRLEHLTAANNIEHQGAHDALVDVRATIALARKLRANCPRLFEFCLGLRNKQRVLEEIGKIGPEGQPFIHISGMYPVKEGCLGIAFPLAQHPTNKNEIIVWNLNEDPSILGNLDPETIRNRIFMPVTDSASSEKRLPIKTIHANKSPIVVKNLGVLRSLQIDKLKLDFDKIKKHTKAAQKISPYIKEKWKAIFYSAAVNFQDDQYNLYSGFISPSDRRQLNSWISLPFDTRISLSPLVIDSRIKNLLNLYYFRYTKKFVTPFEDKYWLKLKQKYIIHGHSGSRTIKMAREEINALSKKDPPDEETKRVLGEIGMYLEELIENL